MNECYRYVSHLFSHNLIEGFCFINETLGIVMYGEMHFCSFNLLLICFLVKTYLMDFCVYDLLLLLSA